MKRLPKREVDSMVAPETIRIAIASLGRRYGDLLIVNAYLNHKESPNVTGMAIACMKMSLKQSEGWIKEGIQYEADQDGLTFDQAWSRALGKNEGQSERLDTVARSVGCGDASELIEAIAAGDVRVVR